MSIFRVIQSECGKMQTRITANTNTFYVVTSNMMLFPKILNDWKALTRFSKCFIFICSLPEVFYEKGFWKYTLNLQENTHSKSDFNILAKQHYWNDFSAWVFSCKLAASFSEHLHKNTSERLLPYVSVSKHSSVSFRNLKVIIHKQLFAEVLKDTRVL